MGSVSVQLGLLAIAKDRANADLRDRELAQASATAAGHRVVQQHVVGDDEGEIRATLTRWVDDPSIDVIIVLGGAESDTVSTALQPLVAHVLPGFTDLFRFLSFQEAGASAMLSSAEAARCKDTFVFVLPGAVAAAMEKLIIPQLDPTTTPKNLVSQMPRLRAEAEAAKDAVPQAIKAEKTQGGSGVAARLPAGATAARAKKHSTGAHVIVRPKPGDFDAVTAPIDLERLEMEIAAAAGDSTKPNALQRLLPRVPPGADETEDDFTKADVLASPPAPSVTINPRKRVAPPRTHPPTSPPVRQKQPSTVSPIVIPPKRSAGEEAPTRVQRPVPAQLAQSRDEAPTTRKTEPTKPAPTKPAPAKPAPTLAPATLAPAPASATTLSDDDLESDGLETMDLEPDPTGAFTKIEPEIAAPARKPAARPITTPPPPPIDRPKPRPPTEPPPIAKRTSDGLPSGTFNYPTQKPGMHPAVKVLGLAGIAALGFFAFVFFARDDKAPPPNAAAANDAAVAATAPVDAAELAPTDATEVVAEPLDAAEIEMPQTRPTGPRPTGTRPTSRPTGNAVVATAPSVDAGVVEPPVEDGCDETSCVLTRYEKACCSKFKPVASDLSKRDNGLPESLDKSMVRAGVEGVKARVTTCGEKTGVKGKVTVQMKVSPDGVVTSAELGESPDPALGACVVGAMRSARFGKSAAGGDFTYPFVF